MRPQISWSVCSKISTTENTTRRDLNLDEDSHDMSAKSSMKENISLTSTWCYFKWKAKPLNNGTYFSICKWCAKSSINELIQEKNSAKIKPLPNIYMHEYDYMFQSKLSNMFGKVYSPDSDSFYIRKTNINILNYINIITPTAGYW